MELGSIQSVRLFRVGFLTGRRKFIIHSVEVDRSAMAQESHSVFNVLNNC